MTIKDEIKSLLAREAMTMTEVASKIYNTENKRVAMSSLSQKLKNETIRFREVREIADILGYDIKFEKRKSV